MAEAGTELDEIEVPEPAEIIIAPPVKNENGFMTTEASIATLATEATLAQEQSSKALINGDGLEEHMTVNGYIPSPIKPAPAAEVISEPSTQISFHPKQAEEDDGEYGEEGEELKKEEELVKKVEVKNEEVKREEVVEKIEEPPQVAEVPDDVQPLEVNR